MEKKLKIHLHEHVTYPATKKDIVEACNKMEDVPDEDKKWLSEKLTDKEYKSAKDVLEALR